MALYRGFQSTQAKFRKRPAPFPCRINFCNFNICCSEVRNALLSACCPHSREKSQNTEHAGGR